MEANVANQKPEVELQNDKDEGTELQKPFIPQQPEDKPIVTQPLSNNVPLQEIEEERRKRENTDCCCDYLVVDSLDECDLLFLCRGIAWCCVQIGECTESCCDGCGDCITNCCDSNDTPTNDDADCDCNCFD